MILGNENFLKCMKFNFKCKCLKIKIKMDCMYRKLDEVFGNIKCICYCFFWI